jgi:murein DD-endopeptidase MepM/ murein hydrolase activator NlpD
LSATLQKQKPVIEAKLAGVEQAQQQVNADIAERQRRLIEEARKAEEARQKAEEARQKAEQARLRAEAEAAAAAEQARRQAEAEAAAAAETARRKAEAEAANRPAPAPVQPQIVEPVAPVIPEPPTLAPADPAPDPRGFGLNSPVGGPISSGFGWRPTPVGTIDFNGTGGYMHTGVDYGVGCGTPLYAPAAGEVWYADSNVLPGAGNRIVLNHGVVGGNVLATNYYHLTNFLVSVGQRVSAGQLIGYTGTTGNSTGCHLHFETMLNGTLVDPMGLL